jgi:hypothetical protein
MLWIGIMERARMKRAKKLRRVCTDLGGRWMKTAVAVTVHYRYLMPLTPEAGAQLRARQRRYIAHRQREHKSPRKKHLHSALQDERHFSACKQGLHLVATIETLRALEERMTHGVAVACEILK